MSALVLSIPPALLVAVGSDSDSNHIFFKLLALLFLVLLNGFFVAAEFALVKVPRSQLDDQIAEGNKGAELTRHITSHLEHYLAASQLGITISSLALGWLGEPFLARLLHPLLFMVGIDQPFLVSLIAFGFAFFILVFLHVILGEMLPKSLAVHRPLPLSLMVSKPLSGFYVVFRPFIWLLNLSSDYVMRRIFRLQPIDSGELAHSEEELRLLLTESKESEDVSELGKEILINALDMRRRVVRDIMTPRGKVIYLDINESFNESVKTARESKHTRFPLCKDHLDEPVGLVHIKDLFFLVADGNPDLQSIRKELHPVPEMMPLEKLLTFFLQKHIHLALVVDEFGGTVGIVTLDNVLSELVGDIQDEFDSEPPEFIRTNEAEFVVSGGLGLYELRDHADIHLESTEVSTVGGYIIHLLGHLPHPNESLEVEGYEVTVTKTDGRSIGQLHFRQLPEPDENAKATVLDGSDASD